MYDKWIVGLVNDVDIAEDFVRILDFPDYDFNVTSTKFTDAMLLSTKDMSYRLKVWHPINDGFGLFNDNHVNLVKFTIDTDILDFTAIISRHESYLQITILNSENKGTFNIEEIKRCKKETRRFLSNFINAYGDKKWINDDQMIKCSECFKIFVHSESDQEFYDFKIWDCPSRCKNCRENRRKRKWNS